VRLQSRGLPPVFCRISGKWTYYKCGRLEKIFFEFLPVCVEKAFVYRNLSGKDLENTIFLAEDQAYIREELKKRSLVAFVNDGAILPRERVFHLSR